MRLSANYRVVCEPEILMYKLELAGQSRDGGYGEQEKPVPRAREVRGAERSPKERKTGIICSDL